MHHKEKFLKAINNILKVEITFNSKEKGQITRVCIPFDFGASQQVNTIDKSEKYHVLDLNSPYGPHNLAITPDDVIDVEVLDDKFDPYQYVTWQPKWVYKIDWGSKS